MANKKQKKKSTVHKKRHPLRLSFFVLTSLLGLAALSTAVLSIYMSITYAGKFYPNTTIGPVNVSGMTKQEAYSALLEKHTLFANNITLASKNVSEETSLELLGITIDIEKTINNAYSYGHSSNPLQNIYQHTALLFAENKNDIAYTTNTDLLETYIENKLDLLETEPRNNRLTFQDNTFAISEGKQGKLLNRPQFKSALREAIQNLSPEIPISYPTQFPKTQTYASQTARWQARLLAKENITLSYKNEEFTLTPDERLEFISIETEENQTPKSRSDFLRKNALNLDGFILTSLGVKTERKHTHFIATLNREKLALKLNEKINSEIAIEPKNARFSIEEDGRISLIEESTEGQEIAMNNTLDVLEKALLSQKTKKPLQLIMKVTGADVTQENVEKLGITEVIGVGESDFAGSPSARRHNINVGTDKLTGILVAPGEEYSLLKHLGKVNAEAGYLPELVIKPGKTVKEYGGGLCQLGSTIFRGAMNSGLKITERQWHSYPVEYYKPYGTDATIYDPAPDFKFLNDTENYILIQGKVDGNKLYFTYYGTNDGRSVAFDGPHTWDYGWAGPGSLKAKWTQIVTYADGSERSKTYWSNYKSPESYH